MTYEEEIHPHREKIDKLNDEIVEKIVERVESALAIGRIKKKHGKQVVDVGREQAIFDMMKEKATESGLDPVSVERVFREIIRLCVEAEREV